MKTLRRTSVATSIEGPTNESQAQERVNRPLHILLAEDNPQTRV
jgi:hypothetical protein